MIDATNMRELEIRARRRLASADPDQVAELARLAMVMHLAYQENMGTATRDALHATLNGLSPEYLLALRAASQVARKIIRNH